jgi:teichuronic acid biosynthesis glycosyltransferase TuaC
MRVLTFTSLYPDSTRPRHGIFIEARLRHLVTTGAISVRVVAPCPWFPARGAGFGSYGEFARVPRFETRHGIPVYHPRYPLPPKVGMSTAPFLMYWAMRAFVRRLVAEGGDFDVIDAHYFYPDGVAAVLLARHFGKPVTVTARGSDLNILSLYAAPRHMIRWAAEHADGLITVSTALGDRLVELGIAAERVTVLRNGVDLALFRPHDRATSRQRLGLSGPVLLSVGNLVPLKRHELAIEALAHLPDASLVIVGVGPEKRSLEDLARRLGLGERVRFLDNMPQENLAEVYSAADVLILMSRHEGSPNVLLEAMACGTPVLVCDIPAMREIVGCPDVGRLIAEPSAQRIAAAVRNLLERPLDRSVIRKYAESFGWNATTQGQLSLLQSVLTQPGDARHHVA